MAKGGGAADDIVKAVLARLGVKPAVKSAVRKAPAKVAPKATAKAASSVPAKTLSREERRAINSARNKATQEKLIAERAAEAPAKKKARQEANRAKGIVRANRRADEAYGYRTNLKNQKAKAWFEKEIDKISRTIDATERVSVKGSQGRRDMLTKQINRMKDYATKEGYELKLSDIRGIVKSALDDSAKAGAWAEKRLKNLVGQTGGKTTREMVDMGARRARSEEIKTGKILTGKKPAYMSAQSKDLQKRLTALDERQMQDKLIKKADSKMGAARGPRKKTTKKFEKTKSEIKLEQAQASNARKSIIDPKVAKMSPAERKKFLAAENKKWKELRNVKITGRGMTDAEAKKKLADLGEREIRRSAVRTKKVKPSPEGLRRQFSSKEPR